MSDKELGHLTHQNSDGQSQMVDVTQRAITERSAVVSGRVYFSQAVHDLISTNTVSKGNVIEIARIAAIMGAKKTPELIPLCHPIAITGADISIELMDNGLKIFAAVKTTDRTGVEMEAFTAASVAALTVIDMIKAVDPFANIGQIQLESKSGGKNGDWVRGEK